MIIRRWLKSSAQRIKSVLGYDLRLGIVQNSFIVLTGQFIRLALGLISSALLARGLGPISFSIFSVIGAATNIGLTIADVGLSSSAVRSIAAETPQADRARFIANSYSRLKIFGGLLFAISVIILAEPIARLLNLPNDSGRNIIWIACIGFIASILGVTIGTLLQALRRFRALVTTQILNAALTVGLLGILYFTQRLTILPALLIVGGITTGAAVLFSFFKLPKDWRQSLFARGALFNTDSRRLLAFGKWLWVSGILYILATQIDPILLNTLVSPQAVGWYALALNLSSKFDLLNQTLHVVLLPTVSSFTTRAAYLIYLRRSLIRSLMLGILVLATIPFVRPFILTVYGPDFAESVNVFYWLLAVVIFDLLFNPIGLLAFPLNLPRLLAVSDAARLISLIAFGIWLVPLYGIYGFAMAKLISKVIGALVLGTGLIKRLSQLPIENIDPRLTPDTTPETSSPDPK